MAISQDFKYCQYCRIYDNNSFNSSSFQQITIRHKTETNFNNMLQHLTDISFFNTIKELQLDKVDSCL